MYVQIVDFRLAGVDGDGYRALCEDLAPAFAQLPGLIAKLWLADDTAGSYGGIYLWRDRDAYEDFTRTDLFHAVASHPSLADVESRAFAVLDSPTACTRGLIFAVTA